MITLCTDITQFLKFPNQIKIPFIKILFIFRFIVITAGERDYFFFIQIESAKETVLLTDQSAYSIIHDLVHALPGLLIYFHILIFPKNHAQETRTKGEAKHTHPPISRF